MENNLPGNLGHKACAKELEDRIKHILTDKETLLNGITATNLQPLPGLASFFERNTNSEGGRLK